MHEITATEELQGLLHAVGKFSPDRDEVLKFPAGCYSHIYYAEDVEATQPEFFRFLQYLCRANSDNRFFIVMLQPDPIDCYFKDLGWYPAFELSSSDSREDYVAALHSGHGNEADAIAYSADLFVIFSPEVRWIVAVDRRSEIMVVATNVEADTKSEPEFPRFVPLEQLHQMEADMRKRLADSRIPSYHENSMN